MIESQGDRSSDRTPADANNNRDDECKPLTLLSEPDTSKCLELNTALQASTSDAVPHHRHTNSENRSNQQGSSRTAASHTAGSSTGSNVANSASATTAGNYVPQQPKSERKAAKTLSAILLAFIITWTPYNVVALLRSTLDEDNQDYIPKPVSALFETLSFELTVWNRAF